jgi:predicted CoA-binding protein
MRQTRPILTGTPRLTQVFSNPPPEKIHELLRSAHIIAVVGLSADPARTSHRIAKSLQSFGYRIIPVTPVGGTILGEPAVPDLDHLQDALQPAERVDVVDVFRKSQYAAAIVDDCIRLKLPAIWLQQGVIDADAAEKAQRAGMFVVMDKCMYRERAAMG